MRSVPPELNSAGPAKAILEVLADLGAAQAESRSWERLVDEALKLLQTTTGIPGLVYFKISVEEGGTLEARAVFGDVGGVPRRIVLKRAPKLGANLAEFERAWAASGAQSAEFIPVRVGGEWVGVLVAVASSGQMVAPSTLSGLSVAAHLISAGLRERDLNSALLVSQKGLDVATETARLGTYTWEIDQGRCVHSPEFAEIIGLPGQLELTTNEFLQQLHPEDREPYLDAVNRSVATGSPFCERYRVRAGHEGLRWVEERGLLIQAPNGARYMVGTLLDIQEAMDLARIARDRQAFLEAVFDQGETVLFLAEVNRDGEVSIIGMEAPQVGLMKPDLNRSLKGRTADLRALLGEEGVSACMEKCRACAATGQPVTFQTSYAEAGEIHHWAVRIHPCQALEGGTFRIVGTAQEITSIRRTEQDLERTRRLVDRIAHLSPFHVYIFDIRCWTNIYTNWSVERLLGYPKGSLPGDLKGQLRQTLHPADFEVMMRSSEAWRSAPDGQVRVRYWRSLHANGDWRTYRALETPIERDASSEVTHILGLSEDVTDRLAKDQELRRLTHDLEERVRERTVELERVNRELESFAYSVSHDLRSPLRSVSLWAGSLRVDHGSELSPEARSAVERIESAAQRMANLMDALLELTHCTRSKMHWERFSMSEMIADLVAPHLATHPGRVRFDIQPNVSAQGDVVLVRALLDNLLGNALKFTRECAAPAVSFRSDGSEVGQVFCIADNGIGFNPEYARRLFQPFERLHSSSMYPGTGIGLATAKRIVERHGGTIWANSVEGQGAEFCFTLGRPPS